MNRFKVFCVILLVVIPTLSIAQNKDLLRSTSKQNAATLRALGEPLDRCSLEASIGVGPMILRGFGESTLKAGDKLLALDGVPVAGKGVDDVVALLRKIPPTSTVSLSVQRDDQEVVLPVACKSSRGRYESLLKALDFAAQGKFDECIGAVSGMQNIDTHAAALRVDCALVSRKTNASVLSLMVAQLAEMAIEDATYVPAARMDVVRQLRNAEAVITQGQGVARYQALVEATKRWPGGEDLYVSSTPDWALFRRNAENALRARLIDPDSARIQWTHGFLLGTWKPFLSKAVEGYWSCGLINARNRMGGYTGSTAFVVVIDPNGYVKYSEIGGARDIDLLSASCANSVKMLPPPPAELMALDAEAGNGGSRSLADELKKLVELRNSGALSEEEFRAAKARLLGVAED